MEEIQLRALDASLQQFTLLGRVNGSPIILAKSPAPVEQLCPSLTSVSYKVCLVPLLTHLLSAQSDLQQRKPTPSASVYSTLRAFPAHCHYTAH